MEEEPTVVIPKSPFAKYSGSLSLGDKPVDCYVLDDKSGGFDKRIQGGFCVLVKNAPSS